MKQQFISLLKATGRRGMDTVIDYLDKGGFFEAPASINRHLCHDGGLAEHSLNVYRMAMMLREQTVAMRPEVADSLKEDSVVIAALLHDVCKSNIY